MVNKSFDFQSAFARAKQNTRPQEIPAGNSMYSFGIVNSKNNGKRLTFSKALSTKLSLEDHVELLTLEEEHLLFIGKNLTADQPLEGRLSGEDKKICYSGPLVAVLTDVFGLDFSKRASMSFSNITFHTDGDIAIAVVHIPNQPASGGEA